MSRPTTVVSTTAVSTTAVSTTAMSMKSVSTMAASSQSDTWTELSNDSIDKIMSELRTRNPHLCGLEPPGLGDCVKGKSLPRFSADTCRRFVQIINIGDHWVTITNRFTDSPQEVFVFDSAVGAKGVADSLVLQASSLMRRYDDTTSSMTVHVRQFSQQSRETRLCGYYAVAAAISCCNNEDPTGRVYDEVLLMQTVSEHLSGIDAGTLQAVDPVASVLGRSTEDSCPYRQKKDTAFATNIRATG